MTVKEADGTTEITLGSGIYTDYEVTVMDGSTPVTEASGDDATATEYKVKEGKIHLPTTAKTYIVTVRVNDATSAATDCTVS